MKLLPFFILLVFLTSCGVSAYNPSFFVSETVVETDAR